MNKKYLITVEAEGIGKYCPKISRFINHPVRAINPELIIWEEGMELSEQQEILNENNSSSEVHITHCQQNMLLNMKNTNII